MTGAGLGASVVEPSRYDLGLEDDTEDERPALPEAGADQIGLPTDETRVDLRPLKRAVRHLDERDPVRQLIEGEPDALPFRVLAAKADSWVLLLLPRVD